MSELSEEKGSREDAYVLVWEENCKTKMDIPYKSDLEAGRGNLTICAPGHKHEYLYDYVDVLKYIKKHLSHIESHILTAKITDIIKVELTSVDD